MQLKDKINKAYSWITLDKPYRIAHVLLLIWIAVELHQIAANTRYAIPDNFDAYSDYLKEISSKLSDVLTILMSHR